jgi:DNA-binding MarR family transcriptional regulator
MVQQTDRLLRGFANAAQSLKLYRRAELLDQKDRPLIEQLYVDPLPNNAVLSAMLRPNTTFVVGRKGTGKSTVFQRAQHEIRKQKRAVSAYIDIKTVFESAAADPALLSRASGEQNALPEEQIGRLLLYKAFMRTVLTEVQNELKRQITASFFDMIRAKLGRGREHVFEALDELIENSENADFTDVTGIEGLDQKERQGSKVTDSSKMNVSGKVSVGPTGLTVKTNTELAAERTQAEERDNESSYARLLMRTLNITGIIEELQSILKLIEVRNLFVFIDDFSELPEPAMRVFVDTILAPLNNWSNELIKFKIAAYPGRIYYGKLDPLKMDEIYLDLFKLYGSNDVGTMEDKAIDFTQRLLENRIQHYCKRPFTEFCSSGLANVMRHLFFASLGNPRTLGHVLFNLQESHVTYGKRITSRAVRDASVKFYDEKIEPFFGIQKFRQETFAERSSAFSLKELLEDIVTRSRELRLYRGSSVLSNIDGQPPTSHFHVVSELDDLLSTLELNFFLTKYFEMKDRDARKVSIYALNYGLCNRYNIEFGRPLGKREYRLYFVERIFDFTSILRSYLQRNREIKCSDCGEVHGIDKLPSLSMFGMLCPKCRRGICEVTNLSKKYGDVLSAIRAELLLPQIELGVLETLHMERRAMFAREIAEELDCSYQLVSRRGKIMEDRGMIDRIKKDKYRRVYRITKEAVRDYFENNSERHLNISEE